MPNPRRPGTAVAVPEAQPTAVGVSMPDDVRADLLRAQAGAIVTPQPLPRIKIMPAAACLFEFEDSSETERAIEGVVLNTHPTNVLWDRPYGSTPAGEEVAPACASRDGRHGVPRLGFRHAAMNNAPAQGTEMIDCGTCPYNKWNSKSLIGGEGKGKACTNQRLVFLHMEGRQTPMRLILPPTSGQAFDRYLATLLNRGIPVQGVLTRVTQERMTKGALTWAEARFADHRLLTQEEFDDVLTKRQQWMTSITPQAFETQGQMEDAAAIAADATDEEGGESAPF